MAVNVPLEQFGKDHWSLLAYVECCCVDGRAGIGALEHRRVRINPYRYYQPEGGPDQPGAIGGVVVSAPAWNPEWGTRLHGFFQAEGEAQAALQLPQHDDLACLEDLEAAGLLVVCSTVNLFVQMTPLGQTVAAQLRAFKAQGGMFARFVPSMEVGVAAGSGVVPGGGWLAE